MFALDLKTQPWQLVSCSAREFLIGMAELGMPQEVSLVGAFAADPNDPTIRTAHRDTDLPMHRDGIYTPAIAAMQDGTYVERPNVDVVGMYCLRANGRAEPCVTYFSVDHENIAAQVDLQPGQAVVWDNRLWHGRKGAVGERLLIRFWTTLHDKSILRPEWWH